MIKRSTLQNIFVGLVFVCLTASAALAQTTAFTYQGKLTNNGTPATGTYEMRFTLYDQAADGFEIGTAKTIPNITVTNGIFTVIINVGDWNFDNNNDRFIEIAVRPQGNVNPFTVLAPLQQVTHTPKSIFSNAAAFANFSASSGNAINLAGLGVEQFVLKNINGEIVAPRLENLATDPESASTANIGRVYFNTTTNSLMVSDGTAWVSVSSPKVQTFTDVTVSSPLFCIGSTPVIRTVTFTKSSAASRLRITFKDTANADGQHPTGFDLEVFVMIDGVAVINPTPMKMSFRGKTIVVQTFPTLLFSSQVKDSFTGVGYADGVAAGTHTLTTHYKSNGNLVFGVNCLRSSDPYLIEIEEIP